MESDDDAFGAGFAFLGGVGLLVVGSVTVLAVGAGRRSNRRSAFRPMRFNPPPNWPEPMTGWRMPHGWQPDPRWGPVPDGWNLWIPNDTPLADAHRPRPTSRQTVLTAAAAALGFTVYAVALGLTKRKTVTAAGNETGPYTTGEVIVAVIALAVLCVAAGLFLSGRLAAAAVTVGFAAGFTVNSLNDPNIDGLFLTGLALLLAGTGAGCAAVSTTARWLSGRAHRRPMTFEQAFFG